MLYLNKNVRFRCENEFLMICDCKNLLDFEVPLCYEPLLQALQKGYDETQPIGLQEEQKLMNDLREVELVSEQRARISFVNAKDIWGFLSYSESEFYN